MTTHACAAELSRRKVWSGVVWSVCRRHIDLFMTHLHILSHSTLRVSTTKNGHNIEYATENFCYWKNACVANIDTFLSAWKKKVKHSGMCLNKKREFPKQDKATIIVNAWLFKVYWRNKPVTQMGLGRKGGIISSINNKNTLKGFLY